MSEKQSNIKKPDYNELKEQNRLLRDNPELEKILHEVSELSKTGIKSSIQEFFGVLISFMKGLQMLLLAFFAPLEYVTFRFSEARMGWEAYKQTEDKRLKDEALSISEREKAALEEHKKIYDLTMEFRGRMDAILDALNIDQHIKTMEEEIMKRNAMLLELQSLYIEFVEKAKQEFEMMPQLIEEKQNILLDEFEKFKGEVLNFIDNEPVLNGIKSLEESYKIHMNDIKSGFESVNDAISSLEVSEPIISNGGNGGNNMPEQFNNNIEKNGVFVNEQDVTKTPPKNSGDSLLMKKQEKDVIVKKNDVSVNVKSAIPDVSVKTKIVGITRRRGNNPYMKPYMVTVGNAVIPMCPVCKLNAVKGRATYCSSKCRVTAYNARKGEKKNEGALDGAKEQEETIEQLESDQLNQ